MISSQVSTISPELSGRWSKARRLDYALACLRRLKPSRLITHRIPVERAAQAYELAAERPDECVQVLITYD
jgi:threonine dehydrogenase-like Zn-dependent dehydrogenase